MTNRRRAQFWWNVRYLWHRPHMMVEAARQYRETWSYVRWAWALGKYGKATRLFLRVIREWFGWFRWAMWYWTPLACKGDVDCWQTRCCEWLESRARSYEEEVNEGF